jgi:hypothetical protein
LYNTAKQILLTFGLQKLLHPHQVTGICQRTVSLASFSNFKIKFLRASGIFYRKPEEIPKSESLFYSGTNQIPLQMQTEVIELQNREITKNGFN